ncbi:hypothetical protein Y1Q_0010539 [Alligator mississippiensis]|uniref:Uncharacterized protein n=1 Tax=Alligator mississippiensis TaxID=8496 RepID=A0A151NDB6_ALLMI|nr:hypothetical protein Y1Q_0010539 [Alligator mississippiensis]
MNPSVPDGNGPSMEDTWEGERRTWELCKSLCISQAAKLLMAETWEKWVHKVQCTLEGFLTEMVKGLISQTPFIQVIRVELVCMFKVGYFSSTCSPAAYFNYSWDSLSSFADSNRSFGLPGLNHDSSTEE